MDGSGRRPCSNGNLSEMLRSPQAWLWHPDQKAIPGGAWGRGEEEKETRAAGERIDACCRRTASLSQPVFSKLVAKRRGLHAEHGGSSGLVATGSAEGVL